MISREPAPRRVWKWAAAFGLWTLLGLSFASQFYFSSAKFGNPVTWNRAVSWALGDWYVFALLSLPALAAARRLPLEHPRLWRNLVAHLAAGAVFSLAYMLLRAAVAVAQGWMTGETITFAEAFRPLLFKTFHFNLLVYFVIVGLSNGLGYYRKLQEREIRTAELERGLAQARLQALQMQLNPHFLFNTLHGISSLMHRDVEAADRMLVRLSELLRRALENTGTQEVTLREELDFLSRYLDIERTRFGERLTVKMNIAPDTLDALVPNLVLQPLVENAIQHGIEPHARPGVIELCARRGPGTLELEVSDNGAGLPGGQLKEEGVGVSNTRARLQQLYGAAQSLEFSNRPEGGVCVAVKLPWRASPGGG